MFSFINWALLHNRRAGFIGLCALYHHIAGVGWQWWSRLNPSESTTHLLVGPGTLSDILVLLGQRLQDLLNGGNLLLSGFVGQTDTSQVPRKLLQPLQLFLHPFDILQSELGGDDLHISQWINISLDVDDLGVVECSDALEDTVDSTDVGQESVSETSSGRGTSGQTGDINTGQESGDLGFRLVQVAEPKESLVRDGDTGLLWVAGVRRV